MSRIELSTHELFMRLGTTPATRSARAEGLFRRLRGADHRELQRSIMSAPARIELFQSDATEAAPQTPLRKAGD